MTCCTIQSGGLRSWGWPGPSLGTVFSLASPFTLLAHYAELDWAEDCEVPRNLIRLSIGLEDPEALWQRIDRAVEASAKPCIISEAVLDWS